MNFKLLFQDNTLHHVSRQILKEQIEEMAKIGGWWNFVATQRQYTPTRYKYLFDCVYQEALPRVAHRYQIVENGQPRPIKNTEELHLCMKWEFLSVQIIEPETGVISRIPGTSTALEDKEFYQEFEENVIAHLTELGGFPDGCLSREEWAELKHPRKPNAG